MLPIFTLSVRALARGRRLLAVIVLLAIPALIALAFMLQGSPATGGAGTAGPEGLPFVVTLFDQLVLPILLPLTALLFATSALGDEVEDRTLVYLVLRPVSRLAVVVAKLAAAVLLTVLLVEISLGATYMVATSGATGAGLNAVLIAGFAGALAYASLFLALGLFIPRRALLAGFLYVLVWEGAAASLSSALATVTVQRYVTGMLHALLPPLPASVHLAVPPVNGATCAAVLTAIFVAGVGATTWGLRRVQLP
jgi:ABC-2 type transport system permease protein